MPKGVIERIAPVLTLAMLAILASLVAAPAALAVPGHGNSAATITASFGDSCRDLAAHSSKDISYVDVQYVDGRRVKDESINSHDHAIDGGGGDEIEFAIVKSGTTTQQFDCAPSNGAPTARLETKTPQCYDFWAGGLACEQSTPRTTWTAASDVPDTGGGDSGLFHWICGDLGDPSLCSWTVTLRGIGSSDPDSDITSWSLDFGDGTSTNGSWSTAPPAEVAHEYAPFFNCGGYFCVITLTVTDSAGQSDSEVMLMNFLDVSPG